MIIINSYGTQVAILMSLEGLKGLQIHDITTQPAIASVCQQAVAQKPAWYLSQFLSLFYYNALLANFMQAPVRNLW